MKFTDLFIRRPVAATVISLVILLLGLRASYELTVREFPALQNAQINVTVAYPGADARLVEGFVTTPLERAIATADGIDFLKSSSGQGISTITANLRLDKDPNEALTEISSKVAALRNQMPDGSEDAVVAIAEGSGTSAMYLSFYSRVLTQAQITDYLTRVIVPQLDAIPGLEEALILGEQTYAMRLWLQADRLTAHNLTASEVVNQIRQQNVLAAVGEAKGGYVRIGLRANTDLRSEQAFRDMVIRSDNNSTVRLGDVARIELGAESYDYGAGWDGEPAQFIGIEVRPEANVLDVIDEVLAIWPSIVERLPEGLNGEIGYDSTEYIRDAISEVRATLLEAVLIVVVVIFLFLGSVRSSLIPAVTVPLSLIGALFLMLVLGYSINLLTLLAMVLAIGMVVDDAIIVLENIHRHIEKGMRPYDAAIQGARELLGPVIAMTLTLMAVYAPIGFLSGITGKLFSEFAFTLAGAVLISGIIALTLTPMMCAKILRPSHGEDAEGGFATWLDEHFETWRQSYKRRLHSALNTHHVIGLFGLIVFASCYFLFIATPQELAPQEDIGFAFAIIEADGYAAPEYLDRYFESGKSAALAQDNINHIFTFSSNQGGSSNVGFLGMIMSPWAQREPTTAQVTEALQVELEKIGAIRPAVIVPPALPTPGQGYPIEFVLKSTADPQSIYEIGNELVGAAMQTGKFMFLAPNLRIDRPEVGIEINREKAALMGVDMRTLVNDLSTLLSTAEANRFSYAGRSYKVIPLLERSARINPEQLKLYYTRTRDGNLVPLASLVSLKDHATPRSIEHVQQLNANTIIGVPMPGLSQGEALQTMEALAAEILPDNFYIDYAGSSRQLKQEGSAMLMTFGFALVIIYLVLAAQFESFRDPLIMLVTVPMSICGALLMLNIFSMTNGMGLSTFPGMTLNIYTQVGLVTLIGVIAKHGILIVEFANKLQAQGLGKREAIEEASSIRMRPILMTTAALVVAMIPLLIADGPGAAARFSMGMVIAAGMTIGTLFTLYVVPAMYVYIGRDMQSNPTMHNETDAQEATA